LRRTIERGEFGKLERLLKERVSSDPSYAGFSQQIRRLATRFDEDGITAYLNQVVEDHDEHGNRYPCHHSSGG
jgi:hypothetical protein